MASDRLELPTVFRECIDYLEENGELADIFYQLFRHFFSSQERTIKDCIVYLELKAQLRMLKVVMIKVHTHTHTPHTHECCLVWSLSRLIRYRLSWNVKHVPTCCQLC